MNPLILHSDRPFLLASFDVDLFSNSSQSGDLQWPFWTKLVVVAIGFTGGLVFMYIQCKGSVIDHALVAIQILAFSTMN